MGTSASPTQGLIQTILTIRGLQHQDEAAALARAQFGLQQAASGEQMLGHIGALASSLPDPSVLLPHIDELATTTGVTPDLLRTIISNAGPNADAIKARAIAAGAAQAGPAINEPAAYANIVGAQPGQLQMDDLQKLLFQGAHQYVAGLPPDQKQTFNAGVASKVGLGQTLGEALNDQIFSSLPPDQQRQAVLVGKGLAPNAGEVIQGRLGAAHQALEANVAASNAAAEQMRISIAMAEAKAKGNEPALSAIKNISDYQQFLAKNSGTFTPEGQVRNNAALNAMYLELKKLDPEIGGLFEPVPLDKPLSATGPFGAFMQKLQQKP